MNSQVIADTISEACNQLNILVKRWPRLQPAEKESCLEALHHLEDASAAMRVGIQTGALLGSVADLKVDLSSTRALREALAANLADISSEGEVVQLAERCLRDLQDRLRPSSPKAE